MGKLDSEIRLDILSESSIDAAITAVEHKIKECRQFLKNAVKRGGKIGMSLVKDELSSSTNGSKNLQQSIVNYQSGYTCTITSYEPYAIYVEYGTGVVGANGVKHPELPPGWRYAIGKTINPKTGVWKYQKHGLWFSTRGQQAHRFMYNAKVRLLDKLDEVWND